MGSLAHIIVGGPTRQAAASFNMGFPSSFIRVLEIEDERWVESWTGRMWASGSFTKREWDTVYGSLL